MRRSQNSDLLIFYPEIERTERRIRRTARERYEEMAEENRIEPVPIRDHFKPVINQNYSGIARQAINANNFELKPALINMVQQNQFSGSATADPHLHLRIFLEIADTVKINGIADDIIRLRLFPFSLRDQARSWLQALPLGSITTWEEMAERFIAKYFPPAKSTQLRLDISTFKQHVTELLYEAWERYKEMLRKCPIHNFADWVQIELFYNGLNGATRMSVDAAAGGALFAKTPEEAYDMLEQMTINSFQWPSDRSIARQKAGVYELDSLTSLSAQVSALTSQIAAMNKGGNQNADTVAVTNVVPTEENPTVEQAQYMNSRNIFKYQGNPVPNHYHPGLRNHENFSYANNKNVLNPPPGFHNQRGEGRPSLEDLVGTFVTESSKRFEKNESRLENIETHISNMGATMKSLEVQIGQLANAINQQPRGAFPSNTEAPFDGYSVDNMRRLAEHAGKPGHLYPLSILCHDIMPPPFEVEKEIGEKRVISFHGVGLSIASKISFHEIASAFEDSEEAKKAYAKSLYSSVSEQYNVLKSAIHGKQGMKAATPIVSLSQPWQ